MKRENLCNSCKTKNINWCDELKEHAMRGFYDCEWYSEKKEDSDERCVNNPDKKVYIDPLVTKEEMASVVAEIKSESYPKLTTLIQYLMCEYLVEDVQIERVLEAGEDFYRAKLKYKEFPF